MPERTHSDSAPRSARAALTVYVAVAVLSLGSLLLTAGNIAYLDATGATPNPPPYVGRWGLDKWGGLLPLPLPWWLALAAATALATTLALTWHPARGTLPTRGRVAFLLAGPTATASMAALMAAVSAYWAMWAAADGRPFYFAAAAVTVAVAVIGAGRAAHLRRSTKA